MVCQVISRVERKRARRQLMLERHYPECSAIVGLVGEVGHLLVHASLLMEHIDDIRLSRFLLSLPVSRAGNTHRCVGIQAQQAFEEGMATVDDARVAQHLLVDHRERLTLLHHRRQLFLVADEDEALNGISLTMAGTEYPHEMGVENLRCLIDDGERERHALEEFTIVKHRCRGGDIHPCRGKHLPHLYQRVTMTRLLPHEVFPVFFGTRGTASDTDEVDVMLHEFRTNLVHRPVGI